MKSPILSQRYQMKYSIRLLIIFKLENAIYHFPIFFHNKMIRFCSEFVQGKLRATNSEYEPNSCDLKFIKLNEFSAFFFKFNEQYLVSSECLLVSRGCTSMMMMIFFHVIWWCTTIFNADLSPYLIWLDCTGSVYAFECLRWCVYHNSINAHGCLCTRLTYDDIQLN